MPVDTMVRLSEPTMPKAAIMRSLSGSRARAALTMGISLPISSQLAARGSQKNKMRRWVRATGAAAA